MAVRGAPKEKSVEKPHAGLLHHDHYKNRLPRWRYIPRQALLPFLRSETPILADFQRWIRRPALDTYFATMANLGTHTFYMVFLPIMWWCGYSALGRAFVHILASGVFFSGFLKDLLCLPRPLSPPLQRITMSGSAALEYGFPSTHTTNAMSVTVYGLLLARENASSFSSSTYLLLQVAAWIYCISISLGRIYCGMHGFSDVIIGGTMGTLISVIEFGYLDQYTVWLHANGILHLLIVALAILILIRVHPEPADDCPCFDDSVAFAGVFLGVEMANWHFAKSPYAMNEISTAAFWFDYAQLGWIKIMLRIVVGVLIVFAWRALAKTTLLKTLPPTFRFFQRFNLLLPRRFFMSVEDYDKVPRNATTDTLSGIPQILNAMRTSAGARGRAVSVGPQSAADAHEALAFRKALRRDSMENNIRGTPWTPAANPAGKEKSYFEREITQNESALATPGPSYLSAQESRMSPSRTSSDLQREDEKDEKEIFSQVIVPRVRYDVEVITKLIVYMGIAFISTDTTATVFEMLGLAR